MQHSQLTAVLLQILLERHSPSLGKHLRLPAPPRPDPAADRALGNSRHSNNRWYQFPDHRAPRPRSSHHLRPVRRHPAVNSSHSNTRRYQLVRDAGNAAVTSPNRRPLALATFMPSRVRILMRSDSNSAIMARTLNSSRPIGSFGSWTYPPTLSLTSASVSSSTMSRAAPSARPVLVSAHRRCLLYLGRDSCRNACDRRDGRIAARQDCGGLACT
jgi:hypothetical protein